MKLAFMKNVNFCDKKRLKSTKLNIIQIQFNINKMKNIKRQPILYNFKFHNCVYFYEI
jgi:hypothetical protein